MYYEKLCKNSRLCYRCTGLSPEKLDELVELIAEHEKIKKISRYNIGEYKRFPGGGHPYKYDLRDRIIIFLFYYRIYMTQEFLGLIFQLHNSNISRTITSLMPILAQIFKVPEKRIKLSP